MPAYMVPWINGLPAGELHPQIDEMAGFAPNTLTPPNGGPGIEFPEILFGADLHCAFYDPAQFGSGPPNFGWGPALLDGTGLPSVCPQHQSGVAGNFAFPVQGTWPVSNRVLRDGAFKAPALRNVELTGPYFHTGSYLTLRQVVDFYFRGGDFPVANASNRDPHIVELEEQAFAFGRTTGADLVIPVNHVFSTDPPYTLQGTFVDGLPDTVFMYDQYPDSDHPFTPEPVFASREAALEDAKNALVKFLLSLTDPRVKRERAPFDRPEIFVPLFGTAPENTGGRGVLLADARFRHIPEVGAAGNPDPLPNFLNVSSVQGDPGNDHFDAVTVSNLQFGVLAPNGGEVLTSGQVFPLEWNEHSNAQSYRLHYSTDNGVTWLFVADVGNVTTFDWTVPFVAADEPDSMFRVTAFDAGGAVLSRDKSNAPFTILAAGSPPFQLVVPNGGEALTSGQVFQAQWNANASAQSYRLHYSTDNGVTWLFVADVGNVTTFDWTVPFVAADEPDSMFRVTAFDAGGAVLSRDKSNAPFTIQPAP
jgi:hypothetical protein